MLRPDASSRCARRRRRRPLRGARRSRRGRRRRPPRARRRPAPATRRSRRRRCAGRVAASFSFAATTSTMRLPYVFPSRIIETVEMRVEDELLRRARLETRRPREELRADDDGDLVLDELRRAPSRGAETTQAVSAPAPRGGFERAEHVGRRAARADADDGVGRADARVATSARAALAVVLGGLPGRAAPPRAAGDERDDDSRAEWRTSPRTRTRRARRSSRTSRRRRRRAARRRAVRSATASTAAAIGRRRRPRPRQERSSRPRS